MKKPKSKKVLSEILAYVAMTLGVALLAFALHFFNFPNNFALGGVSGLSVLASHLFNRCFNLFRHMQELYHIQLK